MIWIWYGPPTGSRLGSRTQSASSDAGAATIPSVLSWGRMALVTGVPSTWANITTEPLSCWYSCTPVWGTYWLSWMSSFTWYFPAMPPRSLLTWSNHTCVPAVSGTPMAATEPVRGVMTPRWIVLVAGSNPATAAGSLPEVLPPLLALLLLLLPPQAAAFSAAAAAIANSPRNLLMSYVSFLVWHLLHSCDRQYENGHDFT